MSIDGKRAGVITMVCKICEGDAFKIMGDAPPGSTIGQSFPNGKYLFRIVECTTCGEYADIQAFAEIK